MKLTRIALPIIMLLGLAATAACKDKVSADDNAGGSGGTVSEPAASDTDTTDETATTAPPAPEADPQGTPPERNYVWCGGGWKWAGGHYVWVHGHWFPPRPGFALIPGRWVEEGGKWHHHPPRWAHEHK